MKCYVAEDSIFQDSSDWTRGMYVVTFMESAIATSFKEGDRISN